MEIVDFTLKVFQEALLNALAHRDYQNQGSVYVKHYPDKVVIENPGGFPEGITQNNIITHPSVPRNKLIAETLQRLKYVQRTGEITNAQVQDLCGYTRQQARMTLDKMRKENLIVLQGKGRYAKYVMHF